MPTARYFGDTDPDLWTHRPTRALPKRVVLDTNVLLDAAFIMGGMGERAISQLRTSGFALYIPTHCSVEAGRVLIRSRRADLIPHFTNYCEQLRALQVPHQLDATLVGIARHDLHTASLAKAVDGWVLTDDLVLLLGLDTSSIHGRSTREVLYESYLPNIPPQHLSITGYTLRKEAGHIFFKAIPHDDVLASEAREFTIFENRDLGRMYFESCSSALVFQPMWNAKPISLPVALTQDTQIAGLLQYRCKASRTEASLKAHVFGQVDSFHSSATIDGIPNLQGASTNFRVMNSFALGNGWKGSLQHFNYGPHSMRSEVWRACRSLIGVSPSTLSSDLLPRALVRCQVAGSLVFRPSLDQVMAEAHLSDLT